MDFELALDLHQFQPAWTSNLVGQCIGGAASGSALGGASGGVLGGASGGVLGGASGRQSGVWARRC